MADTIVKRLFECAERQPTSPAFYDKIDGSWQATEWQTYAERVRSAGRALISRGVEPGDHIAIVSDNRPEWAIAHMAIASVGGVSVPIYSTFDADSVCVIAATTDVTVAFVDDCVAARRMRDAVDKWSSLRHVIAMPGVEWTGTDESPPSERLTCTTWAQFLDDGSAVDDAILDQRIAQIASDDVAIIAYTPGTTAPPKGAILSHENLRWTVDTLAREFDITSNDWLLSFVPLAHPLELALSVHIPASVGALVYHSASFRDVAENLKQVEPSVVFAVPAIWRALYAIIKIALERTRGWQRRMIDWAQRVSFQTQIHLWSDRRPGIWMRAKHRLANYLVLSKLKSAMGMARARVCISAGARLDTSIIEFYAQLDVAIKELYGQAETGYATCANVHGATRLGTVGQPLTGVDIQFATDTATDTATASEGVIEYRATDTFGQIIVRGPNAFIGYQGEPAIGEDGVRTGDLGRIDDEGYVTILGRIQDVFESTDGRCLDPIALEHKLTYFPPFEQAVLTTDSDDRLIALLVLSDAWLHIFSVEHGIEINHRPLDEVAELREAIQSYLTEVNENRSGGPPIRSFVLLTGEYTVEGGALTPILGLRRHVVQERHAQ